MHFSTATMAAALLALADTTAAGGRLPGRPYRPLAARSLSTNSHSSSSSSSSSNDAPPGVFFMFSRSVDSRGYLEARQEKQGGGAGGGNQGDGAGYAPDQQLCGAGATCAEACGKGFASCASGDGAAHCFDRGSGQTCCPAGTGESCDAGYYCSADQHGGTWCCPDSMTLEQCAGQYGLPTLSSDLAAPSSTSSPPPAATAGAGGEDGVTNPDALPTTASGDGAAATPSTTTATATATAAAAPPPPATTTAAADVASTTDNGISTAGAPIPRSVAASAALLCGAAAVWAAVL